MKYVRLGRTGVTVSRLCLGTMNFGTRTPEQESLAIMDKALDLGINFFDTANTYGFKIRCGLTEEIIGRWLAQGGGRRERIVLATKVYSVVGKGPNDRGLSAYHIRRACEDSLRRLQTDHIDLYFMHHVDRGEPAPSSRTLFEQSVGAEDLYRPEHLKRNTPWEEIWQAMETLVGQGKIVYAGTSNFGGWHIAQASERAAARNFLGPVCEQSVYNLKQRTVELEVLPACREYGMGVVPWSPLAGGLLAGAPRESEGIRRAELGEQFELHNAALEAYQVLCRKLDETPANVALAWLLHNPIVTGPIIGPRTIEQLTGSMRSVEIELDDETLTELDSIWPGPGGEAPEAYAW